MDIKNLIEKLSNTDSDWLRVNDELCIHTFVGDYYVVLCKYYRNQSCIIRVDVDNIESEEYDILKVDYKENSKEYQELNPIYEYAKSKAKAAYREAS